MMADEMYLKWGTQFHGGKFVGVNSGEQHYKCILVFLIVDLKKSVFIVVRASSEINISCERYVLKFSN